MRGHALSPLSWGGVLRIGAAALVSSVMYAAVRRGEEHGRSKLNWERVREIRRSDEPNTELARRYGVDRKTIRLVRANATWHDPEYEATRSPYRAGQRPERPER